MNARAYVLIIAVLCVALYVQPTSETVERAEYDFVFTVVNDRPVPVSAELVLHEFSTYLQDTHTLSATTLALRPGESRNIQVRGRVPSGLGPETHKIRYQIRTGTEEVDGFVIQIPVPGTARLQPALRAEVPDVLRQEALSVTARLSNFGNILAYFNLSLEVLEGDEVQGRLSYPRLVQVLAGEQRELGLLFTDRLDPGEYRVRLTATVNEEEVLVDTQPFRVLLDDQVYRIRQGEDLVLSLTGSAPAQSVSYTILSHNRELVRDVLAPQNATVIVPTAELGIGEYTVVVQVTHPHGTDTIRVLLQVRPRQLLSPAVLVLIVVGSIVSMLFSPTARIHIRIFYLSYKLRRQEKRLKELIRIAHTL